MFDYLRDPEAIYRQSFEIIGAEAGLDGLPGDIAPVARRMIHACGMVDLIEDLAFSPGAGAAGRQALASGAPVLCDVRMVAAGIMANRLSADNDLLVGLDRPETGELAKRLVTTRSAAGMDALADRLAGAVVVIGNAPTALFRLLELMADGGPRPALVLGFPVGFVGAAESKAALAESDLPFITLHGRRGGSAIAAAALNALILDGGVQ
jgi:precorrin-8X/cobalt-precorrin-8 methylmutase